MAKKIIKGKIGNAITSVAEDHIVVVSEDVYDEKHQKYQSEINDIAIGGTKWEGEYEGSTKVLFDRLKSNLAQCINDGTIYFVTDSNGNFTKIALGDGSKSHVVGIGPKMDDTTKQELMSKLGLTISSDMGTIQLGKLANHNGVSSQKVVTYERTGFGTDVHEISTVGYVQKYLKTAKAMVYAGIFNAQTKEITDYNNAIISPSEAGNVTFDYLLNGNEGETLLTSGMSFIVGTAGNLEGYTGVSVFGGETKVEVGDMIIIINVQPKESVEGGSMYNEASILIIQNTNLNIADGAITTAKLADEAVTASKLSTDIQSLIRNISKTATYAGIATPTTNPGTPEGPVFYIANGKGTYTNFGGIDVTEDEVVILYYDKEWNKEATSIASNNKLTELEGKVDELNRGGLIIKDEVISQNVQNWLNTHPEATTTVQDHSLTINKFRIGELKYVTPEMFGAVGDGIADDTSAIQSAINTYQNVVFSQKYAIKTSEEESEYGHNGLGIMPKNNTRLTFINGASLIAIKNNSKRYAVINILDVTNVKIDGAIIICDRTLESGQHGFGIQIRNCENIEVTNCKIKDALGDGIIVGSYESTSYEEENNTKCKNVLISNCEISNCRRQGITVEAIENLTVRDCNIHDISGAAPEAGIDIEPNNRESIIHNITIDNCKISNTKGSSLVLAKGDSKHIVISNCVFDGIVESAEKGLRMQNVLCSTIKTLSTSTNTECFNCRTSSIVAISSIDLHNCIVDNSSNISNNINDGGTTQKIGNATFRHCTLINPVISFAGNSLYLYSCALSSEGQTEKVVKKAKSIVFDNCNINMYNVPTSPLASITNLEIINTTINSDVSVLFASLSRDNVGKIIRCIINAPLSVLYILHNTFIFNICYFPESVLQERLGIIDSNIYISGT